MGARGSEDHSGIGTGGATAEAIDMYHHFKEDIALFAQPAFSLKEGENAEQSKYHAAHYELVASAMATKLAHEVDPENQVGCMMAKISHQNSI